MKTASRVGLWTSIRFWNLRNANYCTEEFGQSKKGDLDLKLWRESDNFEINRAGEHHGITVDGVQLG